MNCSFTEKISSLIDGELSQTEAREVERHLLSCSQCEEARADFLNLRSQISSYEASLSPTVQNRALANILGSGRGNRGASAPRLSWGWNWGYAAGALASLAILALVVGLIGWNFYRENQHVAI